MLVGISAVINFKDKDPQGQVTETRGQVYVGLRDKRTQNAPIHMYGATNPCGSSWPKFPNYNRDCVVDEYLSDEDIENI